MRSTLLVKNGAEYIRRDETTRSYRITNLSRFTAVDFYLDGSMPSKKERIWGSARPKHRIFPLGWIILPYDEQKLLLAPDGYSQEYQSSNWCPPDENVRVLIEEFDELLPYQEFDPPISVIGVWDSITTKSVVEGAYKRILLSQLDSSIRLPQVREKGIMYVGLQNGGTGLGCFNYLYMQDYANLNGVSKSTHTKIPLGGNYESVWDDDLGSGGIGNIAKHVFKNFQRLGDMVIYSTASDATNQTFSGGLYYVKLPYQSDERRYFRNWSLAATNSDNILRRSSYGLTKIEVAWKQAGAGAGSIVVKHYTSSGTLIATDTTAATGNTAGFITITPKSGFVDIEVTAGANGALELDAWESRKYTVS